MKNKEVKLTLGERAQEVVGVVEDGLKSASETAVGLCDNIQREAKIIAAMSQQEAEHYIRRKYHMQADKFIDWITKELDIELKCSKKGDDIFAPVNSSNDSENTSRLRKALDDFKKVKDEGEKKGWKKLKELLKAVFGIIFALFIEVAKVVLKLAFSLAVGVIKIGACAITTLASCAGTINSDVVKPIKSAYTEYKGEKASKNVGVNFILL